MEKIGLVAVFDVSQFNKGLSDYLGGINDANQATEKGEKDSFSFARALEVGVGVALEKVAEIAFEAAGAMIDFGKDSIGIAAEFQSSLAILETAAASTGMSMDELSNVAITVGADSRVLGASASGAADAMTGLFKAGLTSTEVFGDLNAYMNEGAELGGALGASFNLAAATGMDVTQASDLAAIALATFGGELETEEERANFISDALDNFVKAADASVAEVDGLAQALVYVGPTASQAGMSIQDTNNALAILSTAGIQGSMAGTTLGAVLADLTKGTDKSEAALSELGISIYDSEGALMPLVDIVGQFESAMAGMTDEEKDYYKTSIFTRQGLRGINVLMDKGVQGWNDMAAATDQAAGIQAQAEKRSQTYAAQMEALEGQIETFQIQIGTALLPVLTDLAETFIGLAEQYGPQIAELFSRLVEFATPLITSFLDLITNSESFGDVFSMLPQPLQDVVNFIQTSLLPIFQTLQEFFVAMQPAIAMVMEELTQVFTGFVANAEAIWMGLTQIINGLLQIILGYIQTFVSVFTGDWDAAWEGIQKITDGVLNALVGIVKSVLGIIASIFGSSLDDLQKTAEQAWVIIQKVTKDVWEAIKDYLIELWNSIKAFFNEAMYNFQLWLTAVWEEIKRFTLEIWEVLKTALLIIIGTMLALITGDFESFEAIITELWNRFTAFLQTTWETLKEELINIANQMGEGIIGVWESIKTNVSNAIENIKTTATNAWQAIKDGLSSAMNDLKTSMSSAFDDISNLFSSLGDRLQSAINNIDLAAIGLNIVKGIADGVSGGLDFLINALEATVQDAIQWVKDFLGISSPSELFAGIGLNTMEGMALGISAGGYLPQAALASNMTNLVQSPVTNSSSVVNSYNRNIDLQINNNGTGNPDTTYYDVVAAFEAVGV